MPIPPIFIEIFTKVYGGKLRRLYLFEPEKWKQIQSSLEASHKIKPDPINIICLAAMSNIEFEEKIRNDKDNVLLKALNEMSD